jgi:hypothetical protein
MKVPSFKEAEKSIDIRKRSRRGDNVSTEEHMYSAAMLKKYPGWYNKTEERVFNETVPFGSMVSYHKTPRKFKKESGGTIANTGYTQLETDA